MPSERIEQWLRNGHYEVTEAAVTTTGLSEPYKLRLQTDEGPVISAKFKRAPDDFDSFNNSPRRELAAYETQKLFLDPDEYVVPPTVIICLPVSENAEKMPDLKPHKGADCAIGVLAYWIEGLTDDAVIDEEEWRTDPDYRMSLGNLNTLTVLIGHQDSIGNNFYRSSDPTRPRLFSVDNGLAFGAMGMNPIRFFSSKWSSVQVTSLPEKAITRLRSIDNLDLQRLSVLAELERQRNMFQLVEKHRSMDPDDGIRQTSDVVQFGMTVDEIADIHIRLIKLLAKVDEGDVGAAILEPR